MNKIPNGEQASAQGIKSFQRKKKGPPCGQGRSPDIPDRVVREIRALSDYRAWKNDALAKRYGLEPKRIKRILDGYTASLVSYSEADIPF